MLKNKIWRFYIKKYEFEIFIRPFSEEIFLFRALIFGDNLDCVGEYDFDIYIKEEKPEVIVDCGANIGFFH